MRLDDIVALHRLCFPDAAWSHDSCASLLDQPMTSLITVENGFLIASLIPPEAEILTLCVHPDARRLGKAVTLINLLFMDVETVHLEVASDNEAARALYTSLGFTQTGRRANYYSRADGAKVDALILQRSLT